MLQSVHYPVARGRRHAQVLRWHLADAGRAGTGSSAGFVAAAHNFSTFSFDSSSLWSSAIHFDCYRSFGSVIYTF